MNQTLQPIPVLPTQELNFVFTLEQAQFLIAGAAKMPWEQANGMINLIQQQASIQIQALQVQNAGFPQGENQISDAKEGESQTGEKDENENCEKEEKPVA